MREESWQMYLENNEWVIPKYEVSYLDGKEEMVNLVGVEGKAWWEELAKKHKQIELINFKNIEVTPEQEGRLAEVNELSIPDGFGAEVGDYVLDGNFPETLNHPLRQLQIKKERESDMNYLLENDFRLSALEIGL